ncbi:MAG: hypothetical protein OHK0015_05220 [Chloroflexi bacterium OHK40]
MLRPYEVWSGGPAAPLSPLPFPLQSSEANTPRSGYDRATGCESRPPMATRGDCAALYDRKEGMLE